MKLAYPQHLTWVLMSGLIFFIGQECYSASIEDVREITIPNTTIEKQPADSFLDGTHKKNGANHKTDSLPPKEDEEEKNVNATSSREMVGILPVELEKTPVPENSEQSLKGLEMPSLNAVATDVELLQKDKIKNLHLNTTESPDEMNGAPKSKKDDFPHENSPKGRTLNYKENANISKIADVLKNTVSSEPKVLKIEEESDKDQERWIKKQRGIPNPVQMSRLNKERNLSGSYLPGLAALNTVNRTSENDNDDKFFIKYQRRKRPWSAEVNSSDLVIPEETTVWSLASLKSTPKEKHYADVKPVSPWSTVLNKPTTEYESRPYSTSPVPPSSVSFKNEDSDWIGFIKEEIANNASIKVNPTVTDAPVKFNEANFTSLSSSLNFINAIPDNEVSNETVKSSEIEKDSKMHNQSNTDTQTLSPEFSNVINESDSTIKPVPSTSMASVSSTTESVKNLSVYPSPLSNSVNELHDEEDSNNNSPLLDIESSFKTENKEKSDTFDKDANPTISILNNNGTKMINSSFLDNSNHPNISKMYLGKNSYAAGFTFPTSSNNEEAHIIDTSPKSDNSTIIPDTHTVSIHAPMENIHSTEPIDITSESHGIDKIVHVTSTMLPDKGKDDAEKSTTSVPHEHSPSVLANAIKENKFTIGLADMFNSSHTYELTTVRTEDSNIALENVTTNINDTSQPKEFNEILLDLDKSQGTTEKNLKAVSVTSESPSTSTLSVQLSTPRLKTSDTIINQKTNQSETKANENVNTIEVYSDVFGKTTSPNINASTIEPEVSSVKEIIKLSDLFNSTEHFESSTTNFPTSVHTIETISTTTEGDENGGKMDEEMLGRNETKPYVPSREVEESTEFIEKNAKASPVENFNNSEDTTTSNYLNTIEPSKLPPITEMPSNPNTITNEDDEQDNFPVSEEDTIYDSVNPVFTRLLIQANDKELCSRKEQLIDSIIRLFKTNGSDIHRKQIVINNLGSKDCLFRNPPSDDGLFPIQVYLTNTQGHNDMFLTDKFIDLWQREGLDFSYPIKRVDKVIGRRKWIQNDNKPEGKSSLIAAIVISSIAGVCLLFIIILLVMIRKRQKGFNYGQRCTPVSLEDYSLDNISVYNSTRRKAMRASKRSYGNPAFDDPGAISHVVNFATLANFYNNRAHIDDEFSQIPTVSVKPDELPPGVETKNRFANVIPIPETRVTLNSSKGNNPDLDTYINANYVKGSKGEEKFYIACQAPMADTVSDFWQMIWEQQSRLVIMLTDLQEGGVEKCSDYLPPSEVLDCHRVFGDLQVTLKKREVREKYVISNLQLKNLENNLWREVVHLWLTCWPAQGIPSEPTAVIAFLIEARSYIKSKENNSPIVVHCSPGTGRTGAIIAIDVCIRDFEVKRTVDVPKTVSNIRKDRAGAVQTKDQYAFIYQVLHLYATKLTGGGLDSI